MEKNEEPKHQDLQKNKEEGSVPKGFSSCFLQLPHPFDLPTTPFRIYPSSKFFIKELLFLIIIFLF